MDKPLASVKFRIDGDLRGNHVTDTVKMELVKSMAFNYGNGTCVVLEYGNGNECLLDTRYETNLTPKTFANWAYKELRARTAPKFLVLREE